MLGRFYAHVYSCDAFALTDVTMLRFDKNKLASYLRQLPAYGEINDAKAGDHSNLYWGQCLNDTYPLEALQVTGIASPIPIPIPDKVYMKYFLII